MSGGNLHASDVLRETAKEEFAAHATRRTGAKSGLVVLDVRNSREVNGLELFSAGGWAEFTAGHSDHISFITGSWTDIPLTREGLKSGGGGLVPDQAVPPPRGTGWLGCGFYLRRW